MFDKLHQPVRLTSLAYEEPRPSRLYSKPGAGDPPEHVIFANPNSKGLDLTQKMPIAWEAHKVKDSFRTSVRLIAKDKPSTQPIGLQNNLQTILELIQTTCFTYQDVADHRFVRGA